MTARDRSVQSHSLIGVVDGLRLERYAAAIDFCTKAIEINPGLLTAYGSPGLPQLLQG